MEENFTLEELAEFAQNEKTIFNSIMKQCTGMIYELKPRQEVIDRILDYDRALSVRKTKTLGDTSFMLN